MLILAQTDGDTALGILSILLFLVVGAAFYFIPTIAAFVKSTPNKMSVLVINLFLGWTFVGWVVALAMAFRDPAPQQQVVIYNQPGEQQAPPQQDPPSAPESIEKLPDNTD